MNEDTSEPAQYGMWAGPSANGLVYGHINVYSTLDCYPNLVIFMWVKLGLG